MKFLLVSFISTLSLFNAVKADLAARKYSQPAPDQAAVLSTTANRTTDQLAADPTLFEKIDFFSNRNAQAALDNLRLFQNRVCLIVPIADDYKNVIKGTTRTSERLTQFALMIMDRDLSIDRGSLIGSTQSPGILNLKDLCVTALTEKSKTIAGFTFTLDPGVGGTLELEWKEPGKTDPTGRECWLQIFTAAGAYARTSFGRV